MKKWKCDDQTVGTIERGAILSPCGTFRYRLWRTWDRKIKHLTFVMLNPSTADATVDDPTIKRCIGFAERMNYGGIQVVNLFAYRATDPRALQSGGYQRGPDNDTHVEDALGIGDRKKVICAWGVNAASLITETRYMLAFIRERHGIPHALHMCKDGRTPAHPLILPYTCTPFPIP